MKTRTIILAGGEGTRLGVLTAKRTKPAVTYAGKYRIIDFPLSNCVNSNLFDVTIIAQYRPQSLIQHIGAGGPWDLNRDFTGGVRIFTPYKARGSNWFIGTADAVQQNFSFIKRDDPDLILILSGDHVYTMDYSKMIRAHLDSHADVTIATISVPIQEAPRFGIVGVDGNQRVTSFVEKPAQPPSNLANMGVYLFNRSLLDDVLWEDHLQQDSSHDFGKNILPALVNSGKNIYAHPYDGYWVDVGTIHSYWQAHMDLLETPPKLNLYNRDWIIHTRTEERAPVMISKDACIEDSMICDGCIIEKGAKIVRSILSPGVVVRSGAVVNESILLTDGQINKDAQIYHSILDKRVRIGEAAQIGAMVHPAGLKIAMVGKNSFIPPKMVIEAGANVGTDVVSADFSKDLIKSEEFVQTRRLPNEI
jgi:glucose-1-phosphate adenylyltransferase